MLCQTFSGGLEFGTASNEISPDLDEMAAAFVQERQCQDRRQVQVHSVAVASGAVFCSRLGKGKAVTALVSSNQTQASNCSARMARK
jgi:hypothetical protein